MAPRRKRDDSSDEYSPDEDGEDEPIVIIDGGPSNRRIGSKFSLKSSKRQRLSSNGVSSSNLTKMAKSSIDSIIFNDEVEFRDYSKELVLKVDHDKRPIWVTKDNLIYLEAFSPLYQQACDFLVAIAEPESRPEFIHTYKLTQNSLYAAVAVSITTENIVKVLSRLCKTNLPAEVERFIRDSTYTFGKAKLVLKDNHFFVESQFPAVLKELLANPDIASCREIVNGDDNLIESSAPVEDSRSGNLAFDMLDAQDDDDIDQPSEAAKEFRTVSFMIQRDKVQVGLHSSNLI
jgi:DNA excision repair protein ERCC-3